MTYIYHGALIGKKINLLKYIKSLKIYTFFEVVALSLETYIEKISQVQKELYALRCSFINNIDIV